MRKWSEIKRMVLWFDFGDRFADNNKVKIVRLPPEKRIEILQEKLRRIESQTSWDVFKEEIKPIEKK